MLRGIRNVASNRVGKAIMSVLFGILIVSFAVWGIADIFKGSTQTTLATVGNTDIPLEQFRQSYTDKLQQISSLERQFKSLLIERSKKKFRLTREGQLLYDFSKQIIQTYDALHSKLQEVKDIISGTIRVATIYSIGLHDLPPYIKRFLKEHPTAHVHVEYRRANQVYDDVLGNVVDLGLVYGIAITRDEEAPGFEPRYLVHIVLTMRAPSDEREALLIGQVQNRFAGMREVSRATVEVVWEPAWSADRMTPAARQQLGLDRPQRLVGAHQAPPRERLAHVREIHDVILLAGGDMQEIELRLGGERDPQRVDEGLGAGVGEVGRMEDGADLHADEMPGIASGSLA